MKYSNDMLLSVNFFEGDRDGDLRAQSNKMLRARKKHLCHFSRIGNEPHYINPGDVYRQEKAIMDEQWVVCRFCIDCMEKELDDMLEE